jgi:hypothetical protein
MCAMLDTYARRLDYPATEARSPGHGCIPGVVRLSTERRRSIRAGATLDITVS